MKTFGGITIDDLVYCPSEEYGSGIKTQLLYAPADFFASIALPEDTGDFEESMSIDEDDLKFKGTLDWSTIDILIDENELKTAIDGSVQRKKTKSEVSFFVLGFKNKVLGFIEKLKNVPMIFGIKDNEGNVWLLGNLRNRAFIETAEATSGKKYEDNSGLSVKVSVKSAIYCIMLKKFRVYTATITQSGVTAPVPEVMENSIGIVSFVYQSPGNYLIKSNGFDNKTVVLNTSYSNNAIVSITKSGNDFNIVSKELSTLTAKNNLLQNPLLIEIRKYL